MSLHLPISGFSAFIEFRLLASETSSVFSPMVILGRQQKENASDKECMEACYGKLPSFVVQEEEVHALHYFLLLAFIMAAAVFVAGDLIPRGQL